MIIIIFQSLIRSNYYIVLLPLTIYDSLCFPWNIIFVLLGRLLIDTGFQKQKWLLNKKLRARAEVGL